MLLYKNDPHGILGATWIDPSTLGWKPCTNLPPLSIVAMCCMKADAGSAFWNRERHSRPWLQEPVTAAAAAKNSAFELECREG